MTRKSKRELERSVEDLTTDTPTAPGGSFDAGEGVTAPFVTYGDTDPTEALPEDAAVRDVIDEDGPGAAFVVVEPADDGEDP